MQKFDVQIALEGIAEAKAEWATAITKFNADVEAVMQRLLHGAAVNYMSAEEVAKASGLTIKRVRVLMREAGLNPRDGKRLLAKKAAETLAENAALLGIEPHEMDLMSPLAYLPMGESLKKFLETEAMRGVKELPEDRLDEYPSAEDLAAKLSDAGPEYGESVRWVNAVIHAGKQIKE